MQIKSSVLSRGQQRAGLENAARLKDTKTWEGVGGAETANLRARSSENRALGREESGREAGPDKQGWGPNLPGREDNAEMCPVAWLF